MKTHTKVITESIIALVFACLLAYMKDAFTAEEFLSLCAKPYALKTFINTACNVGFWIIACEWVVEVVKCFLED